MLSSANVTDAKPFIGCAVAGIETNDPTCAELHNKLCTLPHSKVVVVNDAVGSAFTCNSEGGVVCIAGTGSAARLVRPDLTFIQAGGWGHVVGDQGSAYAVGLGLIRALFDHDDGIEVMDPAHADELRVMVFGHFGIKDRVGILAPLYTKFNKAEIAGLCRPAAELARAGNLAAAAAFKMAGRDLGRMIAAVTRGDPPGTARDVVAVGSVWHSVDLLLPGLRGGVGRPVRLLRPSVECAVGCAVMVGAPMPAVDVKVLAAIDE